MLYASSPPILPLPYSPDNISTSTDTPPAGATPRLRTPKTFAIGNAIGYPASTDGCQSGGLQVPEQSKPIKPPRNEPDIRVVMMPKDTNAEGTIFGGVILSYIDQAAFVEARRQAHHRYVTVCMKEVVFHEPVFVGDVLSLYANATRIGKTSITLSVKVVSERSRPPTRNVDVTQAEVVMVAIDDAGKPCPIMPSP